MLLRKAVIAITIFVILFVSAWAIHEDFKQTKYMNIRDENFNIQLLEDDDTKGSRWFEPFKPREYIRILPRRNE